VRIGVAGSVATDHLMSFPGHFKDSLIEGSLESVSLSFLVDELVIRRGGCAANIAFGLGVLGLNPILIAAVGADWKEYEAWLQRHRVNTDFVHVSNVSHTARFLCTTDLDHNQIASFYPGAMSEANLIDLAHVASKSGGLDLIIITPDDPQAMINHSEAARALGIPFAADPSQQMARMSGEQIKLLIEGAEYLFTNEYESALICQKTGWSDADIASKVNVRITTHGAKGATVQRKGDPMVSVGVAHERAKLDPTGVGDAFRSGFLAGVAAGLADEQSAQLGSMLATYVLETQGTQEYRFNQSELHGRLSESYGSINADQIIQALRSTTNFQ